MKGFVPVTKDSLLEMVANCRAAIDADLKEKSDARIALYISREQERMNTRRWYRLFMLPAARFSFDEKSVREYSANRFYDMFDGCPFEMLKKDAENSHNWLDKLENMATSHFAGEPILLDSKTFDRISQPEKYHWARSGLCYSLSYQW